LLVDKKCLDDLSMLVKASPKLRQHENLHSSYKDPCQKLLNAIDPNNYIRPDRHLIDPKIKLLSVLRGELITILFDDNGKVIETAMRSLDGVGCSAAVQLPPSS